MGGSPILFNYTPMGYNKKILPPLETFKKNLQDDPESINYYLKADALFGPSDSMEYFYSLQKEGLPR